MFPRFGPSIEVRMLNAFARELDTLIKTPENVEKTIGIMEKLLTGASIESMQIPEEEGVLASRVATLKNMMTFPNLDPVNSIAMAALRGKMQGLVANKVGQLRGLQACKELCQGMLPGLSPDGIQFLITTVEGFYQKALSEHIPSEKALASALAKGMIISFVGEPDINKNTALRLALESDEKLKDYVCSIKGTLVGSDAVFLRRENDVHYSPQHYHREAIEEWFAMVFIDPMTGLPTPKTDPMTGVERSIEDVVLDPEAEQVIKDASSSWIESKIKDVPFSLEVRILMNKGLLLVIAVAYPLVKEKYEMVLEKSDDIENATREMEPAIEAVMSQFLYLAEGISAYVEQLPPSCYPYIEKFIGEAAEKLSRRLPLEEVKSELEGKTRVFIDFFHHIESAPLSPISKEGALALVGEAISKLTPLDQVWALFLEYMGSVELEGKVRKECPGCLMGSKEWTHLGVVGKAPFLTEKILAALHETSPSDSTKEAWQTGILLFVPETLDGKPFNLNRLSDLMKERYFSAFQVGYGYMSLIVADEYGETPAGKSEWVLIERGIFPGSKNKDFKQQEAMIKAPYELPELLPRMAGIILNYLNSEDKKCLFGDSPSWISIRCKEMIGRAGHIIVNGIGAANLSGDHALYNIGVGAQRKFGP